MPTLAIFGINSSGLNLAVEVLVVFLIVLYVSLVYWTYADARRRIVDPIMVGCATLTSLLFPYVGTVVYIILRPPEYLEDVHERELEVQAAEVRLAALQQSLCPHCDYQVERDFLRCPSCMRKLKEPCESCGKPLERTWSLCPYCEAEVEGRPPSSQGRRAGRKRGERPSPSLSSSGAPVPSGRSNFDSEAQTGESEKLLGEETMATSAGGGAKSAGGGGTGAGGGGTSAGAVGSGDRKRTAVPASKPSPAAGSTPRTGRPRPSS